jgi:RNA polymerase sigma factor (TIGR02999 family)
MRLFVVGAWAMSEVAGDVTVLLDRWRDGDAAALSQLMPLVYGQLRGIAGGYMRHERREHTLEPTALVNEVFLRLVNQRQISWNDRAHFYTFSARMMRNILKDHARSHRTAKRNGDGMAQLPLSEELGWVGISREQVMDLHRALDKLEAFDERKARLVELRFYLALTMPEAAEVLGISLATVERELRFTRSWLHQELALTTRLADPSEQDT